LLEGMEPDVRARLEPRLVGPMGLDIGADSPASIALSIVAQVFAKIKESSLSVGELPRVRDTEHPPVRSRASITDRTRVTE
jgi:xanthine/CO dehydrogenase XdhC/CoxF family maturation factor